MFLKQVNRYEASSWTHYLMMVVSQLKKILDREIVRIELTITPYKSRIWSMEIMEK